MLHSIMAVAPTFIRCAFLGSAVRRPPPVGALGDHRSLSLLKAFCSSSSSSSSPSSSASGGDGAVNYLTLTDHELMDQCKVETAKSSGPGGQHRNKRETAVRIKHLPTGTIALAAEDRSQHRNRASALARLRILLALRGYNQN